MSSGRGDRPAPAWSTSTASVLAHVQALLGFEMVAVARRRGEQFVVVDGRDEAFGRFTQGFSMPWSETLCVHAAEGRAPQMAPDVRAVPAYAATAGAMGLPVAAYVSLPLTGDGGEVVGVLCAASTRTHDASLLEHADQLAVLGQVLGALMSAELHCLRDRRAADRLELGADPDPLTGLPRRAAWDRMLLEEERRCAWFGLSAAVVSLDVQGLRLVNEQVGQPAGDEVLQAVADALREVAGVEDMPARTGGDEFALLLPEADAARTSRAVAALEVALASRSVSASVGAELRTASGLADCWRAADARRRAESASPRRPVALARDLTRARRPAQGSGEFLLQELLDLARRQLGASIAFVGEWEDGIRTMRALSSSVPIPVGPGDTEPLAGTYCERILDGRLPRVIRDTADEPEALALPITAALPIGSYVGVPVVLSNGELYGTLCCLSPTPDPSLSHRDADFLDAVATSMARVLDAERATTAARRLVVSRLDVVLEGRGAAMVFQPVVSLLDGRVVGSEALARFAGDPPRSPAEWFADAELAGLTCELELLTARAALEAGLGLPGFLALNFSATTICSPPFRALLSGVDVSRLIVEVSEHEEVCDYATVLEVLAPLRSGGLRVAVDDAGAGFASLRHVVLLSPDIIKLDISLVRGIDVDPVRQALATALTAFASQTGAEVVAEGVETAAERDVLQRAGVGLMQGWLAGAGVPAPEYLRRWGQPGASVPLPRTVGETVRS